MSRYSLMTMLIWLFATGCAAQQGPIVTIDPVAPCEEIIHPALLSVPFNDLAQGQEQAEEWILTTFPTSTIDFSPSQSSEDTEIGLSPGKWMINKSHYIWRMEPAIFFTDLNAIQLWDISCAVSANQNSTL